MLDYQIKTLKYGVITFVVLTIGVVLVSLLINGASAAENGIEVFKAKRAIENTVWVSDEGEKITFGKPEQPGGYCNDGTYSIESKDNVMILGLGASYEDAFKMKVDKKDLLFTLYIKNDDDSPYLTLLKGDDMYISTDEVKHYVKEKK